MLELYTFLNKMQRAMFYKARCILSPRPKDLPLLPLLVTRPIIRMTTYHSSGRVLGSAGDTMNCTLKNLKEIANYRKVGFWSSEYWIRGQNIDLDKGELIDLGVLSCDKGFHTPARTLWDSASVVLIRHLEKAVATLSELAMTELLW